MSPSSDASRCTYTLMGNGDEPPAIVIPGGPCRGVEYLGNLAGISEKHPLAVFHPHGTPMSGGFSRGWWHDAADVIALADILGLERFDLIAHSAGTRLALAIATQFPERLRSMVLITPSVTWLTESKSDAGLILATVSDPLIQEAYAALSADEPTSEEEFRALFLRQAPATYAQWGAIEQLHAKVGSVNLAAASAWFSDVPVDARERIAGVRMPPTLVIAGDRDLLTGRQPVRDYAEILNARLVTINACGHYPWVEQPRAFAQVVTTWFSA